MQHPSHIAIIMDGNGRWAQRKGRPRTYGHIQGARAAKKIITAAVEQKLEYLTLFAFSTENWLRPQAEVDFLMRLLAHQIRREQRTLMKNNVRFYAIGDLLRLPEPARSVVVETIEVTKNNTGLSLIFGLSYGGQQEIVSAARRLATAVESGELNSSEINSTVFSSFLETGFLPPPDLIIRTSGEKRLSNFLLWAAAYSEIKFVEKHWPDFRAADLVEAIEDFLGRTRRFGTVGAAEAVPL